MKLLRWSRQPSTMPKTCLQEEWRCSTAIFILLRLQQLSRKSQSTVDISKTTELQGRQPSVFWKAVRVLIIFLDKEAETEWASTLVDQICIMEASWPGLWHLLELDSSPLVIATAIVIFTQGLRVQESSRQKFRRWFLAWRVHTTIKTISSLKTLWRKPTIFLTILESIQSKVDFPECLAAQVQSSDTKNITQPITIQKPPQRPMLV